METMKVLLGPIKKTAPDFLREALQTIDARAVERDREETAERSMDCAVKLFNVWRGQRPASDLDERDGWMFMVFLKAARCRFGKLQPDDYVDGAAYFALSGEAAVRAQ